MSNTRPKAYSYLRFSTPEQMKGDSFRRQTEAATAYAEKHGLDLDSKLSFHDLGVSAFRGANAQVGSLKAFRSAVEGGRIEKGSYLLLEGFDRLSRMDPWDALPIFQEIINGGITIVTLTDGRKWDREVLRANPFLIMESLLVMMRANEESKVKASRLKAAWANKRRKAVSEGHKLTSKVPGWLKLNKATNSVELIKPRALVVQRIFREYLEGTGAFTIARKLNKERVPTFGRADAWHEVYVQKILHNEAVIGRYQPKRRFYVKGKLAVEKEGDALEGYFPAIVSEADFNKAQSLFPASTGRKGRPLANIFAGLVFCSACQGRLHYVNKGGDNDKGAYLSCDNARRKHTCNAKSIRFNPVEMAVLKAVDRSSFDGYSVSKGKASKGTQLADLKATVEGEIENEEKAITNLGNSIANLGGSPVLEKQVEARQARIRERKEHLSAIERQLRETAFNAPDEALADIEAAVALTRPSGDANVRLNGALKQLINRIEIGPELVTLRLKGIDEPLLLPLTRGPRNALQSR